MRSDRIFAIVFSVLVLNEIAAGTFREDYEWWYLISKPALLLSIIGYFGYRTRMLIHPFRNWLLAGFVFSLGGDVFLMFQKVEIYFLLGLTSFLLAHVAYILAFRLWTYDNLEIPLLKKQPWMVALLMLYGIGFFKLMEDNLGEMKLPVIVYMGVILLMAIMALNRYKKVTRRGFMWVTAGAFLFLLSDSVLAYNKFTDEVPFAGVWIMVTYGFAQWAIMHGGIIELRRMLSDSGSNVVSASAGVAAEE